MADKTGEGTSAAATASADQRLKLQTNLGTALMWSRGFGAEESKAAFSRGAADEECYRFGFESTSTLERSDGSPHSEQPPDRRDA
jgi:hypothetical protein